MHKHMPWLTTSFSLFHLLTSNKYCATWHISCSSVLFILSSSSHTLDDNSIVQCCFWSTLYFMCVLAAVLVSVGLHVIGRFIGRRFLNTFRFQTLNLKHSNGNMCLVIDKSFFSIRMVSCLLCHHCFMFTWHVYTKTWPRAFLTVTVTLLRIHTSIKRSVLSVWPLVF